MFCLPVCLYYLHGFRPVKQEQLRALPTKRVEFESQNLGLLSYLCNPILLMYAFEHGI